MQYNFGRSLRLPYIVPVLSDVSFSVSVKNKFKWYGFSESLFTRHFFLKVKRVLNRIIFRLQRVMCASSFQWFRLLFHNNVVWYFFTIFLPSVLFVIRNLLCVFSFVSVCTGWCALDVRSCRFSFIAVRDRYIFLFPGISITWVRFATIYSAAAAWWWWWGLRFAFVFVNAVYISNTTVEFE